MQQLKSCTTKEKSCISLVHCPWLLISFTMMFVPKCTGFPKLYKFLGPRIYIFKKLYNKRKKLYIFGTLSFPLNFIHNGVCSKMYSFFQSCTNSAVLIYIFLKSCTTIKKLYNQRKKLYIFGTLYLALNFIHNDVCTKMCSFFQSCINSVVLIYIFSKSCRTIEKLYNQRKSCTSLVNCPCLLISFTIVFVPKCTVFSKAVQILLSSYIYFKKAVQQLKTCTTKEKRCTSLVHCPWLLISFPMVFVPKCTVFTKAVQILWSSYVYF